MQKKSNIFHEIFVGVLSNFIYLILVSIPSIIGTVLSVFKFVVDKTNGNTISTKLIVLLVFSMSLCLICAVFDIIYFIKLATRPNFPVISSNVKYEKVRVELFFKDREHIFCTREVEFTVLCDELECIEKSFTWSGSKFLGTTIENSNGQYTINYSKHKETPYKYCIRFNACKKRGDVVTYKVKSTLEDIDHEMNAHLSHTVKSPTNVLVLVVTTPVDLIKDVKYAIYADTFGELPISNPITLDKKSVGNLETFEYTINSPNLLYNYRLSWKFST